MIHGVRPQGSTTIVLVTGAIVGAFLLPWLAIGLGMIAVGLRAVVQSHDFGELWICLPAGVTLLMLFGLVAYLKLWRMPRQTIDTFEFDGNVLRFYTRRYGWLVRPSKDLRSIVAVYGRRTGHWGWRLTFSEGGWVYLTRDSTHAQDVVREFDTAVAERTGTNP